MRKGMLMSLLLLSVLFFSVIAVAESIGTSPTETDKENAPKPVMVRAGNTTAVRANNMAVTAKKVLEKVKEAAAVITELEGENETLQAETDAMTEESTEIKKEKEELKDEDSEKVQKMVEEKKEIEDADEKCGIKKEDRKGMKKRDLKIAIIKAKSEKFDCKDKSDDYINARFDFIKEKIVKEGSNNSDIKKFNKDANANKDKETKDHRKDVMETRESVVSGREELQVFREEYDARIK